MRTASSLMITAMKHTLGLMIPASKHAHAEPSDSRVEARVGPFDPSFLARLDALENAVFLKRTSEREERLHEIKVPTSLLSLEFLL